jgi:hypothetical protein
MVKRIPLHLDDVLNRIKDLSDAFTFSRWGDGEWQSVVGTRKRSNCDKHRYFPTMGEELFNVLADQPDYIMGMQGLALRIMAEKIECKIEEANIGHIEWVDSDVFHQGSLHGHLYRIVEAVNTRRVLMVGPKQLREINAHPTLPLHYWCFVDVPARNAYVQKDAIVEKIKKVLEDYGDDADPLLISVCASMPAEIILHEIYPLTKGRHTAIDFGSLWDPLVGVASRGYHRAHGPEALVEARSDEEHTTEAMREG